MTPAFIGFTIDFLGKLIVAYTAMRIHYRVWKEMKVDKKVFMEMQMEQKFAILGVVLIILGFALQAPSKFNH